MWRRDDHSNEKKAAAGSRPKSAGRPLPAIVVLCIGMLGVALAATSMTISRPALVWNFSPSLPEGLYRLESQAWQKGDLVALRASGSGARLLETSRALAHGRLLLKRAVAGQGDVVCRAEDIVLINGVQAAVVKELQVAGRTLPDWSGCLTLSEDAVFLLGEHPSSFDSRYFGPVPSSDIVGVITPVATMQRAEAW